MITQQVICAVLAIVVLALLYKLFSKKERYQAVCNKEGGVLGFFKKNVCKYCDIPVKVNGKVSIDYADRDKLLACDNFKRDCKKWYLSKPGTNEKSFDAQRDCMRNADQFI